MTMTPRHRIPGILLVCLAVLRAADPASAQPAPAGAAATIRGVVLDRSDGSPIADVSVRLQDAKSAVKTDAEGRFELTGVSPGHHVVYVSVVGFILVKRPVDVAPGATVEITAIWSTSTTSSPPILHASRPDRGRGEEPSRLITP